jgi:hypothetical protein
MNNDFCVIALSALPRLLNGILLGGVVGRHALTSFFTHRPRAIMWHYMPILAHSHTP